MSLIKTQQVVSRIALGTLLNNCKDIPESELKKLKAIYKNREKVGSLSLIQYNVSYKLSDTKCGNLGYGRLYGTKSCLSYLESGLRAYLTKDLYHDLDIINAQPVILLQFIKNKLSKDMPKLEEYVDNRDEILDNICEINDCKRNEAKEELLKALFGGIVKDKYLEDLQKEIRNVSKELSKRVEYANLFNAVKSEKNIYGSFISLIAQSEEKNVMLCMREFLIGKGWSPDVLIYDGIMVRKRSDAVIDDDLFKSLEAYIESQTGYTVQIKEKPLVGYDVKPTSDERPHPLISSEEYELMKTDFESRAGLHTATGKFFYIEDNGRIVFSSRSDAPNAFYPKFNFKVSNSTKYESIPFLPLWLKDPERAITNSFSMDPDDAKDGVHILPYKPKWLSVDEPTDAEAILNTFKTFVETLLPEKHTRECFLEWLGQMIQQPFKNSLCCTVLIGVKGCGKDTLGDFIKDFVIGRDYATNYTSNDAYWDKYDTGRHNKIFVKLEEASGVINKANEAALKARITTTEDRVNEKGVKAFNVPNYNRTLMTGNEGNTVPLDKNERRFLVINCSPTLVGNMDYWKNLRKVLFNNNAGAVVGQWLNSIEVGEWPRILPKSELYESMVIESMTTEETWLNDTEAIWPSETMKSNDLYELYRAWCDTHNYVPAGSVRAFGLRLGTLAVENKIGRRILHGINLYFKK